MTALSPIETIRARLAAAQRRLDALEAPDEKPPWWNRVYPVDIPLPIIIGSAAFGRFTIDADVTFFAKGIEAFYSVTGVLTDEGSPASFVLAESLRPSVFDYTWNVRDSSSDRDWGNIPLPSAVMRGGNVQGNRFARGQARVRGGALITVTINPTLFTPNSDVTGLETVTSHSLQVIISGIQVRDGVL